MTLNTVYPRPNDHPIGRFVMTTFVVIVNSLYWLLNVRPTRKRLALTLMLTLAVTSSSAVRTKDFATPVTVLESKVTPVHIASTGPVVYQTGKLAGRNAGDLYAAFMGYKGTVIPAELKIDWATELQKLWGRKAYRKNITPVARQAGAVLVAEYSSQDPGRITLESYQEIAGNQAAAICAELNWEQIGHIYNLSDRKTALTKRISCNMGGRVILGYTMAELLPSADGQLNRGYLDFLLRYGGRRYVESLPALHDDITSFGPLQFTQYAVYDTPRERRGASKVNMALPETSELRIPGSTLRLRENDHFRAGYMFAVSNLADGIRKLNARQVATFEKIAGPQGVVVAQYIATAHNKPAVARVALRRWLDSGGKQPYCKSCNKSSRGYATKTLNNYKALSPTI